ncbi:MAG: hypothetical protein AB1408_10655 [Pseudomonadota bacterium]
MRNTASTFNAPSEPRSKFPSAHIRPMRAIGLLDTATARLAE